MQPIHISTAYTNPDVADTELGKEITAGWIINDHINIMKAKIDLKAAFHLIPCSTHQHSSFACPPDKLEQLTGLTRSWLSKHKATIRELLSLIGKLSFAKVAPAVRLFLCCLIDLSPTVRKLHHHISLNALARADIMWWDSFLHLGNGVAIFVEPDKTETDSLQLFIDASGSLGFGNLLQWCGWNCSPSWLLPAHGVPSGLGYTSTSTVTTSPFPGLVKTVCKTA
eukprot:Em0040g20a